MPSTTVPRGIYAIPPTPFTDSGAVDEASLARAIDFVVAAGGHGLVYPVNASEAIVLTDAERHQVTELAVAQVAGRIPVVIGVSGASTEAAVVYARWARESGADAVIAMPPFVVPAPPAEIVDFYAAVAAAADPLPVWIQDFVSPVGTPMSVETLVRIFETVPGVRHIKEETLAALQTITALKDRLGNRIEGLMGGMAGRFMLEEIRRGATGSMPACEVTDVHVAIWDRIEAGDAEDARDLHSDLLPLLNYESMYGYTIYKEVLVRRGIIASARTRVPGAGILDRENHRELDAILDRLAPHFRL